jgi:uncharacterized protein (DUF433 family)
VFLLGRGVENPADGIHGDEEYLYVVELPTQSPDEPAEWTVKVSEHSGFPRWDGPTEEAFERATWQFHGSLKNAHEEMTTEPDRYNSTRTIDYHEGSIRMAGTGSGSESEGTMPQIVKTEEVLGGDPRIENHRIGVYHVYQRYVEGNDTPEEIATSYDISVAEIHAALAYAFSNPEEMREIEARNRALYDEVDDRVVPGESD